LHVVYGIMSLNFYN